MRSQCIVPSWCVRQHIQIQEQQKHSQGEESNRYSYVDDSLDTHRHSLEQHNTPMSNFEVTELTWENGHLAMHELGAIFPQTSTTSSSQKPTWEDIGGGAAGDTLESIGHQATYFNPHPPGPNLMPEIRQTGQNIKHVGSVVASSGGKWAEKSGPIQKPVPPPPPGLVKKRTRPEADRLPLPNDHESACASGNAVFSKEMNETTMMTWSYESPRSSTRTKTTNDEDSACHGGSENQEEERETKETGRSYPTRKGRAAAVHNQSERRRRDRINQKMKALQKLVPNSSKTDKASMLDEVIEYLKQLQAQVQMISNARFMPQMIMPLGIQQHLQQMSLLARMGMGMGMGMSANLGMGMGMGMRIPERPSIGHTTPAPQSIPSIMHPTQAAGPNSTFVPPAFVPQMMADHGTSSSAHMQDAYSSLLAQSMNLELYNRMAALQRHQQTSSQPACNQLQPQLQVQQSCDRTL